MSRRVVILVVLAVAAAGCAAPEAPRGTDGAQATPRSAAATRTPAAAEPGNDTLWRVIVDDLVVRSEPSVADPATIFVVRLTHGDRVLAVDGPVAADGYEWYQVLPMRSGGRDLPFGWVAQASREGEPWMEAAPPECPGSSALGALVRMAPEERLVCFGSRTIEFTAGADGGCGVADAPVVYEPSWLFGLAGCGFGPRPGEITLLLRFPPDAPQSGFLPGEAGHTIVGHFDDPASRTCRATAASPDVAAPSQAEAVAICRTQFVVESVIAP